MTIAYDVHTAPQTQEDHVPDYIRALDALWSGYLAAASFPATATILLDFAELTGARPSDSVALQLQQGPVGVAQVIRQLMLPVAQALLVSPGLRLIGPKTFWIGGQIEPGTAFRPMLFWARLIAILGDDPDTRLHDVSGQYLGRHLSPSGAGWVARIYAVFVGEYLAILDTDRDRCLALVDAAINFTVKHVDADPRSPTMIVLERASVALSLPAPPWNIQEPGSAFRIDLAGTRMRIVVNEPHTTAWAAYLSRGPANPSNH